MRAPLLLLLAGCASAFGFAPFDLWPCTLLALAWLIAQVQEAPRARDALWRGWLFGVGHFLVGNNWVATAFIYQGNMPAWLGWLAVLLMALYLAVYPALASVLAWQGAHRQPLKFAFLFAATWMLGEWLRSWVFTGYAWDPVGAVWLSLPWVSRAASVVGALGLSGLFVLLAGLFWWGLTRSRRATLGAAVILTLLATVGQWMLHAPLPPTSGAIPLRIVQANIGQDEKYDAALEAKHAKVYADLSGVPSSVPRLLLWPEAATLRFPELEPSVRTDFAALLGPHDLLLTGADSATLDLHGHDDVYRNSVFALDSAGTLRWRYDKAHLVPFGEYLPARHMLERIGLARLVPSESDFTAGTGPRSLPLEGFTLHGAPVTVGVQICYEITFPGHVIDAAHRPTFVFNPSNDAWFGSWGPPQHLAQARLRAIEEGLAVIRSTPNGVSAIIDPQGQLVATLGIHRLGVIDGFVPEPKPPTVFSRWGVWASALFGLLLCALGITASRQFDIGHGTSHGRDQPFTTNAAYSYKSDPAVPVFPDDRPIIIFDGYCVLCSRFARFVLRHDRRGVFRLTAAQTPLGQALLRHLGLDPVNFETNVLLAQGQAYFKSDGTIRMLAHLGFPWYFARLARVVPRVVRDSLYDLIAKNRLKWFGSQSVCFLADPSQQDRFLK